LGFQLVRQKGSHIVLRKSHFGCVIPNHKKVAIGTLRCALKQANISPEEFIKKYKNR
jgi:predicted RNA binding protein YcfA (HicA-like mRNA interferase family)